MTNNAPAPMNNPVLLKRVGGEDEEEADDDGDDEGAMDFTTYLHWYCKLSLFNFTLDRQDDKENKS